MAAIKSIDFLPSIFRTTANKKFLNATLDQLIQEPEFKKINGYIGRTFAPTAKSADTYIQEPSTNRQHYQLEPGLVITNGSDNIEFFSSYIDVLDKIKHYGGSTVDHSRLFSSEYYSFSGVVDLDKLVNFNQYYWLPTGPQVVTITSGGVALENTYAVEWRTDIGSYRFDQTENELNPTIILSRGGSYKFAVNQPSSKFWIQTELGTAGRKGQSPNLSTREILGVTNNGTNDGTVTFEVPQLTQQDFYIKMPLAAAVDYATDLSYAEVSNQLLSTFLAKHKGLDGKTTALDNKTLIFAKYNNDPDAWVAGGIFDYNSLDSEALDNGPGIFSIDEQYGIWRIALEPIDQQNSDYIIRLTSFMPVHELQKVVVKQGNAYANVEFFKTTEKLFERVPNITAPLSTLYYQDSKNPRMFGKIVLVDPYNTTLEVDINIVGQKNYTSPTGVKFTNGLKIKFDSSVRPLSYANKTYYVEGVGKSIQLVDVALLVTPETNLSTYAVPYDATNYDIGLYDESTSDPVTPDYILSSRASQDLSAWSRQNRWFHEDVIRKTAEYNGAAVLLDQNRRAKRPIIEFNPGLQLFNFGRQGKTAVHLIDFTITNAFSQIEYSPTTFNLGIGLETGNRIIFAGDSDPLVRNKIYRVKLIQLDGQTRIHLELDSDSEIAPLDGVVVLQGAQRGTSYWFDGTNWHQAQQKVANNQPPLFDIVDFNGISVTKQIGSNFAGTPLFSYKQGTGAVDAVLGFSVGFRNSSFNSVGDIEFVNNYEIDSFATDAGLKKINQFFIKENHGVDFQLTNTWTAVNQPSKQYQILSYQFNGTTNYFDLDVAPAQQTVTDHLKVYINNQRIDKAYFQYTKVNARPVIVVDTSRLANGDRIDIRVYSTQASALGFYEIPVNLDYNALNQGFSYLSLGQMRNHLSAIADNNVNLIGQQPGYNNIRDLDTSAYPGTILQHSAPVIYSNLFLLDSKLNFVDAVTLAQKEYARFKNRFLELAANTIDLPLDDAVNGVDRIMQLMNVVKTNQFPWYYSDMVPATATKKTIEYTVYDKTNSEYEITAVFNDQQPSRRAVLLYHYAQSYELQGTIQSKPNLLTQVDPQAFEFIQIGQMVSGANVPHGTYITEVANTGHKDTSTVTLSSDLSMPGIVTVKTVPRQLQLLKDRDYVFDQNFSIVKLLFPTNYGDKITIVEYENTNGSFVPETPTKLGLYPKFEPRLLLDNTYQTPTYVIQGHDGSITPTFGDYRDNYLLELERRIFNNIKLSNSWLSSELYKRIPGKFRQSPYSLTEFTKILSRSFLNWTGNHRIDFSKNQNFQPNDPFTWNYKKFNDTVNNEPLLGYWRGIFKYFYDTDRPHTHPWEMFGFGIKPDWWEDRYGPTPITSENARLWEDVRTGYIAAGPRQGIDAAFARQDIAKIIPVDQYGNLRSPEKFAVKSFNSENASGAWAIGDHAPVETAWRRSSDYAFSLQIALAVTNPGYYFAVLMNTSEYQYNSKLKQYIWGATNQKLTPLAVIVNSDSNCTAGYLNWVVDALTNNGFNAQQQISQYLNNVNVQLVYKAAGFSDKKYLTVLAEQSSPTSVNESIIIPNENYKVHLTKSAPTARLVYSAVIIERTETGYKVQGYDANTPYFTIIPSLADNQFYTVESMQQTGTIYENFQTIKVNIPYGFEFNNKQQVVDFLISYQRYLVSQGLVFEQYNTALEHTQDWVLSVREFLTWSVQNWSRGSVLVLSPAMDTIRVAIARGNIDEINVGTSGSRILDLNFQVVRPSAFVCSRIDNEFELTLSNEVTIGLVELHIVEYEHALLFDNETVFNDIIYRAELGNRQFRLKLVGNKTSGWNGTLNATGFIYNNPTVPAWRAGRDYRKNDLVEHKKRYFVAINNTPAADTFDFSVWTEIDQASIKTGLLPNFAYNAARTTKINDIDEIPADTEIEPYSTGIIGFRPRDYLTDLNISKTSQAKFYQGFIKEKGTTAAIGALSAGQFADLQSSVNVHEEWAVRVGEYGALNARKQIEIVLDEDRIKNNPTTLRLFEPAGESLPSVIDINAENLYVKPTGNFFKFASRSENSNIEKDILTAGYVNAADVDTGIFDITQYQELKVQMSDIGTGYRIWTARDFNGSWNVYRVSETDVVVSQLVYLLDEAVQIVTNQPHGLEVSQLFMIKNVGQGFDGFYRVVEVIDNNSVSILFTGNIAALAASGTLNVQGLLFTLDSLRFEHASDLANYVPPHGWRDSDKIWVDNDQLPGQWAVFNKTSSWNGNATLPFDAADYQINSRIGTAVKLFKRNTDTYLAVGRPAVGAGNVIVFSKENNNYAKLQDIKFAGLAVGSNFGQVIEGSDNNLFVSAPQWNAGQGFVAVYEWISQQPKLTSVIAATINDSLFGHSISVSRSGHRLYVGAPGANQVQAFTKNARPYSEKQIELTSDTVYTDSSFDVITVIYNDVNVYIAGIDFTFNTGVITFSASPAAGTYTMVQASEYQAITTFTEANSSEFGYSVKTTSDGLQLVVGDPGYNHTESLTQYLGAGRFYVYDCIVEAYKGNGTNLSFSTRRTVQSNSIVVKVDDRVLTQGADYQVVAANLITLVQAPASYAVVRIETTEYQPVMQRSIPNVNAALGYSVDICSYNCTVVVSAPQYDTQEYHSGLVQRYLNAGRVYGKVLGNKQSPTVTIGHSIRINDFELVFTDSTLESVVDLINQTKLPGISASIRSNQLEIVSNSKINADRLRILPGTGTALADLGLDIFTHTQDILHPGLADGENFGTMVRIDPSNVNNLLIASRNASTYLDTVFDSNQTLIDTGSTNLVDTRFGTGAVYILQLMTNGERTIESPSQYVHVQQLESSELNFGDEFGAALDMLDNEIAAGAPGDDAAAKNNCGQVYLFNNTNNKPNWEKVRSWSSKVDVDLVDGLFIYDKVTKQIVQRLDFIDPAKGKVLGVAQENIDFVTEYDPARYNQGNNLATSINRDYFWAEQELGKVWWDVSTVRYVDYEQGDIAYRTAVWGNMFPGSIVQVYEWVKSTVPPSQYAANADNGQPKYIDDSAYVAVQKVDPTTLTARTYYYFWVGNKATIGDQETKTLSTQAIARYISEPQLQSIPYAAFVKDNAVALYNVNQDLVDKNRILHINYSLDYNNALLHSEYALIKQNSANSTVPQKVLDKMLDSLIGANKSGSAVPDPLLNDGEKIGLSIRPRQTLFVNREQAVKNFISFVNRNLRTIPVLVNSQVERLFDQEPLPTRTPDITGEFFFNQEVVSYEELEFLNVSALAPGYKILVKIDSTSANRWAIYALNAQKIFIKNRQQAFKTTDYWTAVDWYATDYQSTAATNYTVELIKDIQKLNLEVGDTIKVKNNGRGQFEIYRVNAARRLIVVGIENGSLQLSSTLFSATSQPNKEFRNIFAALQYDIFIDNNALLFNQLFFAMVNYVLSEQVFVDWIFKTSFISVFHRLKKLEQFPNFIKDNQTYYEDYIKEVKPYRTKIREYSIDYVRQDIANSYTTDFDLPAYWSEQFQTFRSPNGEQPSDILLLDLPQYQAWRDNHDLLVDTIQIQNPGTGYTIEPLITIVGGGGTGATARALINSDLGQIDRIIVTSPGSGYTSQPQVVINGTGGNGLAYAYMTNPKVRSFDSTIKFDRVQYSSKVKQWHSDTEYDINDLVSYQGKCYQVLVDLNSGPAFVERPTTATWAPATVYRRSDTVKYDATTYICITTHVSAADSAAGFSADVSAGKWQLLTVEKFYRKLERSELIADPGVPFEQRPALDNAMDRTMASYNPGLGMQPKVLNQIFTGLDYAGVKVDGWSFNQQSGSEKGFDMDPFNQGGFDSGVFNLVNGELELAPMVDAAVQSYFDDALLGTRVEDINVVGGKFVDTWSSHAPEELIPGMIYDHLDIQVFTKSTTPSVDLVLGYRIVKDMLNRKAYYRISAAGTTTLAQALEITDEEILVTNVAALPQPNPAAAKPGVVYINGEKITYYQVDRVRGALMQIRRAAAGTGAATVHAAGSMVVDACESQEIKDAHSKIWLTLGVGTVAAGNGLLNSQSSVVQFLKESPSFLP